MNVSNISNCNKNSFKGATSRFAHLVKFSLNFSSSSFVIRVNILHPLPSLFLYGLLLSLWCLPILVKYNFKVSFNFKVILHMAQNNSNIVTELTINQRDHRNLTSGFNS